MADASNKEWHLATCPEDIVPPFGAWPDDPTGRGQRMLELTGNVVMTQGPLAGQRFAAAMLDWQRKLTLRIFGDPDCREAGIKIGKGQGKSLWVAATVIALVMDWAMRGLNHRMHVVIVAAGIESGLIVFNHIRHAIQADPHLVSKWSSNISRRELQHKESGITIRVIAPDMANAVGIRTACVVCDEAHAAALAYRDFSAVVDQLIKGGTNADEFIHITITTAATARVDGYYREWLNRMRGIRDGTLSDIHVVPCLWEFPTPDKRKDLDPADSNEWWRGCPSLITPTNPKGTMTLESLERELERAANEADLNGPAATELFLSQRLGIEASDRGGGSGATPLARHWAACVDPDLLVPEGASLFCGLDPSAGLDDPFAVVAVITSGGDYYVWSRQFLTREAFESAPRKLREVYDTAVAEDELVIADNTITLEQSVFAYCKQLRNATFGGDARGLAGFVRRFEEQLGAYKAVPQNWELRAALEYANGLAADRRIHHAGQPLLSYNVANLIYESGKMAKYDATSSGIGSGKIDGCMAMLSAIQIAESEPAWDVSAVIG